MVLLDMMVLTRRGDRDALIAATARVHGLTVVTRNTADFVATGVELVDPLAGRQRTRASDRLARAAASMPQTWR